MRGLLAPAPVATVAEATEGLEPHLVVLASIMDGRLGAVAAAIRELAATRPIHIAGKGATARLACSTGAVLLTDPPVAAANQLVESLSTADRWRPRPTSS